MAQVVKKHILVVEDSPDLQSLLAQLLVGEGFTVSSALNGQEALERLLGATQLPDMILLDIMMPVMDGLAFYEKVKEHPRLQSIPIVFMTADSHPEVKLGLTKTNAVVRKPIDVAQLIQVANSICN